MIVPPALQRIDQLSQPGRGMERRSGLILNISLQETTLLNPRLHLLPQEWRLWNHPDHPFHIRSNEVIAHPPREAVGFQAGVAFVVAAHSNPAPRPTVLWSPLSTGIGNESVGFSVALGAAPFWLAEMKTLGSCSGQLFECGWS